MTCFFAQSMAVLFTPLGLVCLLTLAVILVNGWTDAPNAIATAVATGALSFRRATLLSAICNLLGVVVTAYLNTTVAETVFFIADFGPDPDVALAALCAALCAIVLWATLAWRFGIPTSESHALIAGLSGAALALGGGLSALRLGPWLRVLAGLAGSVGLGLLLGRLAQYLTRRIRRGQGFFRDAQRAGVCAMAFLHGAQDGQKFIGVFLLGVSLAQGQPGDGAFSVPLPLAALTATVMALGTLFGGRRIVEAVGMDMVHLSPREGFAADLAGAAGLLACTLLGLPASTTHTKTAAILGVGWAGGGRVDRGVARSILLAWVFTFPCCGLIGYGTARLFLCLLG